MTRKRKSPPQPSLARRLLRYPAWFLPGLLLGLLVPWIVWLDHEAGQRFAERQWTLASRVYARPLELYPGLALQPAQLEAELQAAGISAGDPAAPGRYRLHGQSMLVHAPAFRFPDGVQPPTRLSITLAGGQISRIRDADDDIVGLVRLPPAEIGSLIPLDARDRTLVALADFPPLLVTGVQAVEDRQFRHHHGLDPKALVRAAWRNLVHGEVVQGGSTITQQLVKNLYLGPERSYVRKFNEAVMAFSLERRFSKAEILETYLNEVWLGQDGGRAIHGFGRAAEHYFGLPVQALSPEQIALLVGMVRGASWYHPERNPERALARRNQVLDQFMETGLLPAGTHAAARARPLAVRATRVRQAAGYPAFMDLVRRQLRESYRDRDLREAGLRIFTTLSPGAQAAAEHAVTHGLSGVEAALGTSDLQAAVVLVDPGSGEVRALVGDRLPSRIGFNRALDARRQVGSVIKPFVYLLALAQPERFTLVSPLEDGPLAVPVAGNDDWMPRNHDGRSHGRIPLLEALTQSYNQATVRVGLEVGVPAVLRLLQQLGVPVQAAPHPSVLLGALDLTPMQVAQLYQPLAADGYSIPLRAITAVVDSRGRAVSSYPLRLRPIRERQALALVNHALEEAVRTGTGQSARHRLGPDLPIAGKTGTTNDRRDAWFVGYTPDWLGVVWVGRDDNRPAGIGGATGALPVWAELFAALPVARQRRTWPEGIEWFWIDWPQALLAEESCDGARAVPFVARSEPADYSTCLDAPRRSGLMSRWRR